jgi:L-rhamnose-H+ transport protein
MVALGLFYTFLSGLANGLFTAPMKIIPRWKWENIWLVFIVTACGVFPALMSLATLTDPAAVWHASPAGARAAAIVFGGAWGFGAILFGMSVDRLGVSLANSLVIGLSSALGSLVPLALKGEFTIEARHAILFAGVAVFLVGVWICGTAGRMRDASAPSAGAPLAGYLFAIGSGVMSAVFNIGYSLALPIADAGVRLGHSRFAATNFIWLLMLWPGAVPNILFCGYLLRKNATAMLFARSPFGKTWGLGMLMGVLWGASIYLYGAATPLLGDIGPSIGWPLSLAVGLVVANLMGALLGEWRAAPAAGRRMRIGIAVLLVAVVLCALSAKAS